ncbi:ABC transporter substrate-binding protein [Candidatus Poriferisodalis sp.]|uniref:ABC transporter substrate-binding protein n=1 Tax=Candidatus Poriferisodalis sp. TaxID=3101277 RepID=UPI003B02782A
MIKRRMWRLLALLFAFSLVAAACGGDDDADDAGASETETETTAAASEDEAMDEEMAEEDDDEGATGALGGAAAEEDIEAAVAGEDDDEEMAEEEMAEEEEMMFDRSTLQGIFDEAAARRAKTVAELTEKMEAGEYGVSDDGILRGPAGFEIDMNECPSDWSSTTGITDSQVRIGHTTAQSGNLAAYGVIADGWENYFDWMNANDPIMVGGSPRDLTLIVKDDGYVAAQTIEFVDELIEAENVFSILTLGSPNTLAVYDKLNEECIPQPFVMTGHPAWGDPVNHPWTTGLQMSYSTESILWGAWIRENLSDLLPVKVAGLVMDNDFGLAYELGFHEWAEANTDVVSEYLPVRHDPAAPTLTNEMTTIAAFEPDVFISMTAGNPCLLAIQEAGQSGLYDDINAKGGALFTPSVCKAIEAYMKPAGDYANNWWIVGGGIKDSTDPKYVDEPFIAFVNDNLVEAGLDPAVSLYATGYMFGYPYGEALRIAADLPGGLNRTNFILAVRSIDMYHPQALDGINAQLNGSADAYFIEGSDFSQFDAGAQTWNIIGDIVDVNGRSTNCAWDKDNGGCR